MLFSEYMVAEVCQGFWRVMADGGFITDAAAIRAMPVSTRLRRVAGLAHWRKLGHGLDSGGLIRPSELPHQPAVGCTGGIDLSPYGVLGALGC